MAELNFKQITDKLNEEFKGDVRKLIFWYDPEGDFAGDVDSLELVNAKVYHLEPDNQFRTKLLLEREDTTTNYLIYAPFPKPDIRDNHLADTLRYSKEFFADRASLLMLDLNMDPRCKPVIERYIRFFADKKRTQDFYDLDIGTYTRASIEIGLMSVLCRCKLPVFEEVARCVLTEGGWEDNAFLAEFEKYDLAAAFWQQCALVFGYSDAQPTLTRLAMTLFVTYGAKTIHTGLPTSWQSFVSFKSGTVTAFLDSLMNSVLYQSSFDALSARMAQVLDAEQQLKKLPVEALVDCNLFPEVDAILLQWMTERLLSEDVGAKLSGRSIPQLCEQRRKMHFGGGYQEDYAVMENAWHLLSPGLYTRTSYMDALVEGYRSNWYQTDRCYRWFYAHYDALEDNRPYQALRSLVERVYTNDFLNPLLVDYSEALTASNGDAGVAKQYNFYQAHLKNTRDRVAVIISDAMRYEVGVSLFEALQADEKCTANLSVMQSMLPSVTRPGMAALLPHRSLTMVDEDNVTVDGLPTLDLKQREAILRRYTPASRAVQYDEIKGMTQEELRDIFAWQEVVYIYHNQIDARGDHPATENEVFTACEEAVEEIARLIRRLTISANTSHFIVTSDHGFLYRRDKLTGSDKIGGIAGASDRYVITDEPIQESGVCSMPLSGFDVGGDGRFVNHPKGPDLFRAPGAGKNYVHGGCSPQETLVPVIEVKTERAKRETTTAAIDLVSLLHKITNLITALDFIQTEPVSDVVKAASYRVSFVDDAGSKISNEALCTADKKDQDAAQRMFRLKFSFKNQRYDRNRHYYLIAVDQNGREVLRREVVMDLAFAVDDFGF